MRVLMLSDFYRPLTGGVEVHVEGLSRALVGRGHQVTVATLHTQGLPQDEVLDGVRVRRLSSAVRHVPGLYASLGRPWAPPFPDPMLARAIGKIVEEAQPDVVHGHDWLARSYFPAHRRGSTAFVTTLHYYTLSCARKDLLYQGAVCSGPGVGKCLRCASAHYGVAKGSIVAVGNWPFSRRELRATDSVIAVSHATARGNGIADDDSRCAVIPNFLLELGESGSEVEPYLDCLPQRPFMLFVGDLRRAKGIEVLLAAYRDLPDPPALVLLGDVGPETSTDLPPGTHILSGWPNRAVRAAWERCLFGVLPSIWAEPFGLVLLECMAAGRPVIASRIGGIPEVVADGETGVLVDPGDANGLARAMNRLVADPGHRETMGEAARVRARMFGAEQIVPRIEAMYREAIARRRAKIRAAP
ncbi:MAG TPA: glycosyltransferase family 4 protein [Thermomicrobiales bacterium]|nr:glycosyltransferase family 4 protein [Thermomicrobiales bacterium]